MYADDTVVIAETYSQLKQLMDIVVQESENKGLCLNSLSSTPDRRWEQTSNVKVAL